MADVQELRQLIELLLAPVRIFGPGLFKHRMLALRHPPALPSHGLMRHGLCGNLGGARLLVVLVEKVVVIFVSIIDWVNLARR